MKILLNCDENFTQFSCLYKQNYSKIQTIDKVNIKAVRSLSNYPFRGRTEGDSVRERKNNGKASEGQIIMGNIILLNG